MNRYDRSSSSVILVIIGLVFCMSVVIYNNQPNTDTIPLSWKDNYNIIDGKFTITVLSSKLYNTDARYGDEGLDIIARISSEPHDVYIRLFNKGEAIDYNKLQFQHLIETYPQYTFIADRMMILKDDLFKLKRIIYLQDITLYPQNSKSSPKSELYTVAPNALMD